MLLKLTNRWRSRSNTFKDIYISLSSEFIEDVKLLFRFLISWLVSELWPKDWTPMSKFSDFWGVFRPSWPSQTKIQKSGSTNSNDHCFGGFAKIWLKSVAQIRRIFCWKKIINKPSQNRVAYATRATTSTGTWTNTCNAASVPLQSRSSQQRFQSWESLPI